MIIFLTKAMLTVVNCKYRKAQRSDIQTNRDIAKNDRP